MRELWLDTETCNETPISVGEHLYAETARIQLLAVAHDDGPVDVYDWELYDMAGSLDEWIREADRVYFHHASFDCAVLARHGVQVPLNKRYCTMAQARRHALPGALDKLCELFEIPQDLAKIKDGRRLMMLFCKPQKDGSWCTKHTHPLDWAAYKDYARHDVLAMRELHRRMPTWNDCLERAIWQLDQTINTRGFHVDEPFAREAIALLAKTGAELERRVTELSAGAVTRGTQRDRILQWILEEHGVELPDLTAATLERRLNDPDLPQGVRDMIGMRQQSAKSSTAKFAKVLQCVSSDGRMRGTKTYCGARPGRWTGKNFQPDNMPRLTMPVEEVLYGIDAVRSGCFEVAGVGGSAVEVCSNGLRGLVSASAGHRLLVADLSNIEGRVAAWLSGERWKLAAFRNFDQGSGPDLYRVAYGRAFNVQPAAVNGSQRQIGKVLELMMGFGGGVGAFITGADTYRIDLEAMSAAAWPAIPRRVQLDAEQFYFEQLMDGRTFGLSREVFSCCDALKRLWRESNPAIVAFWRVLEDAVKAATVDGEPRQVGEHLSVDRLRNWLRIQLPSGRYLCYPSPKIGGRGEWSYMGLSAYTRSWQRNASWGGVLLQNVTEGVARDVLAHWLLSAEKAGFNPVLHVHDDITCEVAEDDMRDVEGLVDLVTERPPGWAQGLPLHAKGFESDRYIKEE